MNTPYKLFYLPGGSLSFEVFCFGLSIGSYVHIELCFISFWVDHARVIGQVEGAEPQRINLETTEEQKKSRQSNTWEPLPSPSESCSRDMFCLTTATKNNLEGRKDALTLMSLWKVSIHCSRLFMGTIMSCTT